MILRTFLAQMLVFVVAAPAYADGCRLDHATYVEARSGAEIQFRPKDPATDAALTTGQFELRLPHVTAPLAGDVTWNAGRNARPDGAIARPCGTEEDAEGGRCWLWTGNVFTLDGTGAGLLDSAEMAAPKALLFSDFGRALAMMPAFVEANPESGAFDVFTLNACKA